MLKKIIPIVLLAVVLAIQSCQSPRKSGYEAFTARVDSVFMAYPDFSGVALIAEKGKPVYHNAFGYRSIRRHDPMDTSSVFELASVSKQFTSMAIMMLKAEGKLEYDDPIEKYLPGLPYPGITIRHLLTHTSGLPDYQAIMDQYWDKSKVAGNEHNIAYLIQYHPPALFAPGDQYKYSNTGYMLLASIAEKASGQDFINFVRARIFVPLKMVDTDIRTMEAKQNLPALAWGHIYVTEKERYVQADSFPQFNYSIWLGDRKGPGRISSTATDLLKWDRALYDTHLVAKAELDEAFTPATLNNDSTSYYGFGWTIGKNAGAGKVVRHSGSNPGYNTHIVRFIESDKTIILLCNNAHAQFKDILARIEGILTHDPV
jgi:CubicO group peptidase (beta-lactamase class C family)